MLIVEKIRRKSSAMKSDLSSEDNVSIGSHTSPIKKDGRS
jgi:hypothetical protein